MLLSDEKPGKLKGKERITAKIGMDATSDKASTIRRDQKTGKNPEILKTGN
jgi:hypothetical protein